MASGLRWTYSIQERSDGKVKELKLGTGAYNDRRTSAPEDHRVEESSSLSNYHPGFATGVVIPSNFEEYQRKSDRIGEVIFSSAGNRCLNSDCIYPTGEDIKKALKKAAEPGGRLLLRSSQS